MGMPTGLCIPVELDEFISVSIYARVMLCSDVYSALQLPPWQQQMPEQTNTHLIPPTTEPELEAITAIQNLANTVIANAASRSLARFVEPLLSPCFVLTFVRLE